MAVQGDGCVLTKLLMMMMNDDDDRDAESPATLSVSVQLDGSLWSTQSTRQIPIVDGKTT